MARRIAPPTSATDARASIDLTGPFFERDVEKTIAANIRDMLGALSDEGERVLAARSPRKTGAFAEGIVGRTHSLGGKAWWSNAVISATHIYPWGAHVGATINRDRGRRGANRGQAEYRGGKLEARWHMFRNVASQMRGGMRAVTQANLTKGLE